MYILIFWLALCLLAGWIAAEKGRSGVGFFLLAFFCSPLIGVLAAFGAQPRQESRELAASAGVAVTASTEQVARHSGWSILVAFGLILIGLVAIVVCMFVWGA